MRTKWGGLIPNIAAFDPEFFNILPLEACEMDPRQRLLLMSTWRTLEDAGYDPGGLRRSDTGVFIGCEANEYAQLMRARGVRSRALFQRSRQPDRKPNFLSFRFCRTQRVRQHDVLDFCSRLESRRHRSALRERPSRHSRSGEHHAPAGNFCRSFSGKPIVRSKFSLVFGREADGYLRSEGVGTVLIERLSDAEAAHRYIYAIVKHTAVNYNGHGRRQHGGA